MFDGFIELVREIYGTKDFIPLHEPRFLGNEKKYLIDTIDSTFVSSVGVYVDEFEKTIANFTNTKHAVATVNGTSALHIALLLAGVSEGDEVITQSLTFIATCNAINYCHAEPIFVDVERSTLGLSPESLEEFLEEYAEIRDDGFCWNKKTNRPIRACLPMHTFGHATRIDAINEVCERYNIALVEDAAESLGSYYNKKHTGTMGKTAALSFNGNKIITTGGGGMILTNDTQLAKRAKHITTTAKKSHAWFFEHDEVGFNYRMPNLNAAIGLAQMEQLPDFISNKRQHSVKYNQWCKDNNVEFVVEPEGACSNYWLNSIILESRQELDDFLVYTNGNKVMTRPVWTPMHRLPMFKYCQRDNLKMTNFLADRLVNIPSSVKLSE
jgi:perosamine synthetase